MKKSASPPPEAQSAPELFRALELAHYAARFRDKTFVIGITAHTPLQNLLLDLKVLAGYRIRVVLVCADPQSQLEQLVAQSGRRGMHFHLSLLSGIQIEGGAPAMPEGAQGEMKALLNQDCIPIIAFRPQAGEPEAGEPEGGGITFALAAQVALMLGAHKLFLAGGHLAGLIAAAPRSHVLHGEIESLLDRLSPSDQIRFASLLNWISDQLARGIPDIVLIDERPGQLFQEVFTHEGAGLLFDKVEREVVRQARMEDVTDIVLLLRAEIEEGSILPIDENLIEQDIHLYWVYEIDGLVVGSARLKTYQDRGNRGDWAEVAQFATLPRYRGKGHARTLGQRLEQEAAAMGFRYLFALSIFEGMWRFLESEGFSPVERAELPAEWRESYDMNRPSRAYLKDLKEPVKEP